MDDISTSSQLGMTISTPVPGEDAGMPTMASSSTVPIVEPVGGNPASVKRDGAGKKESPLPATANSPLDVLGVETAEDCAPAEKGDKSSDLESRKSQHVSPPNGSNRKKIAGYLSSDRPYPPLPPRKLSNNTQSPPLATQSNKEDTKEESISPLPEIIICKQTTLLPTLLPTLISSPKSSSTDEIPRRPPLPPRKPSSSTQSIPKSSQSKTEDTKIESPKSPLPKPEPAKETLQPPQPQKLNTIKCTHPELLALPTHTWDILVDPKTRRIFYQHRLSGTRTYTHPVLGALPRHWTFRVEHSEHGADEIRTAYFQRVYGISWEGDPRDPLELAGFNAEVLERESGRLRMEREAGGGVDVGVVGSMEGVGKREGEVEGGGKRKATGARRGPVRFGDQVKATSVGGTVTLTGVK